MFRSLLVANRGEIACRVMRTARALGIRTVAVYSDADRDALHVREADVAVRLGPAPASESYLSIPALMDAVRRAGADALHPGYGFLSESPELSRACAQADCVFVGPPPEAIEAMGEKDRAKRLMEAAGVPVVPGRLDVPQEEAALREEARALGVPVLIKAVRGGGGKGMRRVASLADFDDALRAARGEARAAFGDDRVLVEKCIERPRHVEVQVFADAHGHVVHLFERDCSVQRRHQKVLEEAPAPRLSEAVRRGLGEAAVRAARAIDYRGAGTCEFILDPAGADGEGAFYFMEMNTRLQVEHPVTECITGVDLVEWQLRVAAGERLPLLQAELERRGHAVEVRLYAEDPTRDFLPQAGTLSRLRFPEGPGVRVDAGVREGDDVPVHYDPLLAKLIAHGDTREAALTRLAGALARVELLGVVSNLPLLRALVTHPAFVAADLDTGFLARHPGLLEPPRALFPVARALSCVAEVCGRVRDDRDPWAVRDGFRLNGPARHGLRIVHAGETLDVACQPRGRDALRVAWGDEGHEATGARLRDGVLTLELDGHPWRALVASAPGGVWIGLDGHAFWIAWAEDAPELAGDAGALGALAAPMPGQVLRVEVKVGERVARGQPLARMSAMKMEHTLRAGADGVVSAVRVRAGQQVGEGDTLLTLDPPEGEGGQSDAG